MCTTESFRDAIGAHAAAHFGKHFGVYEFTIGDAHYRWCAQDRPEWVAEATGPRSPPVPGAGSR